MKQLEEKEKAIRFLVDRIKKHLYEAFGKLHSDEPAKDCVDISIYLMDELTKTVDAYTKLMANRMQHYSNVASMLAEKMSKFSEEIRNLRDDDQENS